MITGRTAITAEVRAAVIALGSVMLLIPLTKSELRKAARNERPHDASMARALAFIVILFY